MSVIVSLSEVYAMSRKALEGAGLPQGLDEDGGANTAWLEARGLGGIAALAEDLPFLHGVSAIAEPVVDDESGRVSFHMDLASGYLIAPSIVDWALSGFTVDIPSCRSPMTIVAEAARRATEESGFAVAWSSEGSESHAATGQNRASVSLDIRGARRPSVVSVAPGKPPKPKDSHRLDALYRQSITKGVEVDSDQWAVLADYAKRVLVPASTASRSGAGAEVDDSA